MPPPLIIHPSYVSFENLLDERDDHCRSITISSTTNEKFRVISIKGTVSGCPIEFAVDTTDEAVLHRVKFNVSETKVSEGLATIARRRFLSGTIRVRTTNKSQPVVEIPWSAMLDRSVSLHSREAHPRSSSEPRL